MGDIWDNEDDLGRFTRPKPETQPESVKNVDPVERKAVFTFTDTSSPYPGYVSIYLEEDGKYSITVRTPGQSTGSTISITPVTLEGMSNALADELFGEP